jgi:hypothetical protein
MVTYSSASSACYCLYRRCVFKSLATPSYGITINSCFQYMRTCLLRATFKLTESWVMRKEMFSEHAEQGRYLDCWLQNYEHSQANINELFIAHYISAFLQPSDFKAR